MGKEGFDGAKVMTGKCCVVRQHDGRRGEVKMESDRRVWATH